MRKVEKLHLIKSVGSGWVSLGTNVAVGIFLSPYILHRLGDAAFGIWVLIFAITGYYGLFDLGIRSSIVRYVAKAKATGDLSYAGRVISTSLFSYTCIGIAAQVLTLVLSTNVNTFFKITPEFHSTARWLLLMVGTAVSLGFPLGVSGGVLEGLQQYSVLNWTSITATVARAILIIVALRDGYGLLMVAFITVSLPVLTSIIRGVVAMRILHAPISFRSVNRSTFREIAGYSGISFVMIISARLRFKTDSVVIGTFLSASAITYFNIGSRIVDYAGEVVESLAQIFVPMSSHSEALGDLDRLRKIFVAGNRACSFTFFPLAAILVVLGKSVIEAWVGQRYVATSYPVLIILLSSAILVQAQGASVRILMGIGQHRTWAIVTLIEGVVNLVLSIALVRPYGIVGDALGTTIPLALTMLFILPWHLCRKLEIRMVTYLREAYALPVLVCAPLVAVLLLMQRWFVPHNYPGLLEQLALAGIVYGLALAWAIASRRAMKMGRLHTPIIGLESATAVETITHDA